MAADPMSMSLDALIEQNKSKSPNRGKSKFSGRGGRGRGRGRGRFTGNKGVAGFGKPKGQNTARHKFNRNKKINTPFSSQQGGFRSRSSLNKQKQKEVRQKKGIINAVKQDKLFTGALVEIDPLNPDIVESDIKELCSNIGEVRSIKMSNSRRVETRSKGAMFKRAIVRFRKKGDAETAVEKLNRRALDDTVMNVSLKG